MSSVPPDFEAIISVPSAENRPTRVGSGLTRFRRRFTFSQGEDAPALYPLEGSIPELSETAGRDASMWAASDLGRLIHDEDFELETYGLTEYRDGFFDALFLKSRPVDREELEARAEMTLPASFRKRHPLSVRDFVPKQWHGINHVVRVVTTTRAGVKLSKSFIAVFAAYLLCLVPAVRHWLGKYCYIMVVSTVINHPGRTVGAQIDGTVSTILGTVTGLGWGAFGLWLSTSTQGAQVGYGAILAVFLALYIAVVAAIRSYFIRLYQAVICAGIAVSYACLSQVSGEKVAWGKLLDYGIPWVLGQAICLIVCVVWFPDAGARRLAVALNDAFETMLNSLDETKSGTTPTRQHLAQTFVNLSQAYRDLVIDFSFTLFDPKDVRVLRNHLQASVRGLLALRPKPSMFSLYHGIPDGSNLQRSSTMPDLEQSPTWATAEPSWTWTPLLQGTDDYKEKAIRLVRHRLEDPTSRLLRRMKESLRSCHAVLMDMSGYRKYLGPGEGVDSNLVKVLVKLRKAMIRFDDAESELLDGHELATIFIPEVVEGLAYCRPIRQAATAVESVLVKVNEMEQRKPSWPKIYAPSYPWQKALNRVNSQVRHDRGGVTAGSYYRSFEDIARAIQKVKSSENAPAQQEPAVSDSDSSLNRTTRVHPTEADEDLDGIALLRHNTLRHRVWEFARDLQGFEMRFALKTVIVTTLLAIPAWLDQSRHWWNLYGGWWAVAMAWVTMHPRVGGNAQDLATRAFMGALGAIWGGAAFAAGDGNPYIMAVFALIFLVPMLYRFTQSHHPRSGLVGCLSFIVSSLALMVDEGHHSPVTLTIGRGVAFVVGVVASVVINWILWPFIARHELRKAMAAMMFFLSILYRTIIAQYVYYEAGNKPTAQDIEMSEVLEGRLREGFVRIRQLMGLTRHEIRLRAPFDPLPYSALADSCERFFEYLVAVRQSALYFHPKFIRDNDEAVGRLLIYRRDAVAAILGNLYTLAGALRTAHKVPKYLPSAAASRKRLMDKLVELEVEYQDSKTRETAGFPGDHHRRDQQQQQQTLGERKKWMQIYSFSYNESLTGCVAQLEELERYTKLIVGEQGFDDPSDSESDDDKQE